MDNPRFDSFTQHLSTRLTRRTGLGVLAGASLPLPGLVAATDAKTKAKKVTLCFNGQTVKKPKQKAQKLQQDGAGKGTCRCGNGGSCFVFVTANDFRGSSLSGLAGADASCQQRASAAGLPGTYKAWLSDENASPLTRFSNINKAGPYVLPAPPPNGGGPGVGLAVSTSFTELVDCAAFFFCLEAPINRTENGQILTRGVWTGTESDGSASPQTCNGWTSDIAQGLSGNTAQSTSEWTGNDSNSCGEFKSIYCFQQAE